MANAPTTHAKAVPSIAKGAMAAATATTLRKALQPLDSNRAVAQPPPAVAKAVAKAPFAYVSRFSRPLAPTTTTMTHATAPTTTAGVKRKHRHGDEAPPTQPTHAPRLPAPTATLASDVDPAGREDPLEQQRRENVAWLDMLVALLERKYQAHAPPVCVDDLERARMLDAYWTGASATRGKRVAAGAAGSGDPSLSSGVKRSRLSLSTGTTTSGSASDALVRADEKEEKRLQALRRHAQQIQDTSVSSTSCCGCKTGCLKMYCVCFSTRGYCHDGCSCDNCKNSRASADQRLEAITTYLTNDPRAFSYAAAVPKAGLASAPHGGPGTGAVVHAGFFQLLPEKSSTVVLRGCRCKKSKCLKKYCECFQNGLGCGPHCRCVDCSNDSSPAARELRDKNKHDPTTTGGAAGVVGAVGVVGATATATGAASAGSPSGGYHAIKVAVTKKPRRNYVLKSVRLRL